MTVVELFNRALAALGHDRFISSEDSPFIEAVHCRREWDGARQGVLAAHEWGWLVLDVPICDGTETTDEATGKTVYIYPRPSACLRLLGVTDTNGKRIKWRAVNAQIEADTDPVKISYLQDSEDPDDWPAPVQDAVVTELAARIAIPLKQDAGLAKQMRLDAVLALAVAKQRDSLEVRYDGSLTTKYADARR